MNRRALALLPAAVLAACGEEEQPAPVESDGSAVVDNTTTVTPSTPLGSVAGTVLDGAGRPLAGATVSLRIGTPPAPATTDAEGHFQFTGLPAGSVVGVEIVADGYGSAQRQAVIPSSAGNFPINDASVFVGPVALWERTGELAASVIGWDGRAITASGAYCEADASWADWATGMEQPLGPVAVDALAAQGSLTCAELPRLQDLARTGRSLHIVIPALDADGNGTPDYDGLRFSITAAEALAAGGALALVLPEPGEGESLRIVGTNARTLVDGAGAILDSAVPALSGVDVAFSRRVEVLDAKVYDEEGRTALATAVERAPSGTAIRIRPEGAGAWPEGRELNLVLSVATADGVRQSRTYRAPILTLPGAQALGLETRDPADPNKALVYFEDANLNGALEAGERILFRFTQAIGHGNGARFAFPVYFQFNIDADVSATIGDSFAEAGSGQPAVARGDEPAPPVGVQSGMTRFASLTWTSGYSIPINAPVIVDFGDQALVAEPMFATDGRPLTVELSGELRQEP